MRIKIKKTNLRYLLVKQKKYGDLIGAKELIQM